jgi:hypothetical protein
MLRRPPPALDLEGKVLDADAVVALLAAVRGRSPRFSRPKRT